MNGKQAKRLRDASTIDGTLDEGKYKSMKRMARTILMSLSQTPKFEKARQHKPTQYCGPTWPNTLNQARQGRQLIVIKPVRAIINKFLAENKREDGTTAPLTEHQRFVLEQAQSMPKHRLDQLAI